MVLMKSTAGLPSVPKASCVKGIKLEPWAAATSAQASFLSSLPLLSASPGCTAASLQLEAQVGWQVRRSNHTTDMWCLLGPPSQYTPAHSSALHFCACPIPPLFSPDHMRVTRALPRNPAALAFVPFGIVLVRVRWCCVTCDL